ncbi:MAG: GNAT family N-acetyltransferase [Gemmatimonadaceae bacterium]
MTEAHADIRVRNTEAHDLPGITALTRAVYPDSKPWNSDQLWQHLDVFPEGQFVAVTPADQVVAMAASLVILWDDYESHMSWREFTSAGTFSNHDPEHGRTLYGAEVMVHPDFQRRGIGKMLYAARRELAERRGLLRIRAGARLRGYHEYAERMSAEEYVRCVVRGDCKDPTLSFQLRNGFHVLAVVTDYLRHDPESLGYAAIIEWLNPAVAKPGDYPKDLGFG